VRRLAAALPACFHRLLLLQLKYRDHSAFVYVAACQARAVGAVCIRFRQHGTGAAGTLDRGCDNHREVPLSCDARHSPTSPTYLPTPPGLAVGFGRLGLPYPPRRNSPPVGGSPGPAVGIRLIKSQFLRFESPYLVGRRLRHFACDFWNILSRRRSGCQATSTSFLRQIAPIVTTFTNPAHARRGRRTATPPPPLRRTHLRPIWTNVHSRRSTPRFSRPLSSPGATNPPREHSSFS
jgi:hypothetical protein